MPTSFNTSANLTPVQEAHPTAPVDHWLPLAGGLNSLLPFPPHSNVMLYV